MKVTNFEATQVHGYLPITIGFHPDLTFLTGLNGSGKTTALRLLMGLLGPDLPELCSVLFQRVSETNQMRIDSAKKGRMNTEFFLFGDDTVSIDEESYPEAKRMLDELEGEEFELTIAPASDAERTPSSEDTFVLHAYVKRESERASDPRPAIKRKCDEYLALLERIVCECHEKFENR